MNLLRLMMILLLAVIMTVPALTAVTAQSENSRLIGVVLDRNSARIVGAVITIQNTEFKRHLRSDAEGKFEVELPVGYYEITAEQPGFKKFKTSFFRVSGGTTQLINIHMEVEPPKEPLKINSTRLQLLSDEICQ